jgi:hypothetical protein
MMRVVVLHHSPLPPSMLSMSFLRMHQWHSNLLLRDTSRRCNPWQNHNGPSEIAPRYLTRQACSYSYCTDKGWATNPDSDDASSQWQQTFSHDLGKTDRCLASVSCTSIPCPWPWPCTRSRKVILTEQYKKKHPSSSRSGFLSPPFRSRSREKPPKSCKREKMRVGE